MSFMKIDKRIFFKKKHIFFLAPGITGIIIFILVPFLDSFRRSFLSSGSGTFVGLKNYSVTIKNEAFILAVKNTCLFTAVCIPILLFLSFFIAYILSKRNHIKVLKSMMLFPMAVPTAVLVMVWRILFCDAGYINSFITKSGHESIEFLSTSKVFWLLVGSYIWKNLGYTILLWMTGISGVSASAIEAAGIDGANEKDILLHIIIPDLKPTFYTITIISFLNSFKVFREAYLVAGAYPDDSIYLLQHLFNNWFLKLDLDKMAAAAVMVFSVIFVVIVILQRIWDRED